MATAPHNGLLIGDQTGNLYLLPWETVEQARISDEERAALEQRLTAGEDTSGYAVPLFFAGAAFGSGATVIGYAVAKYVLEGQPLGPVIERAIAQFEGR